MPKFGISTPLCGTIYIYVSHPVCKVSTSNSFKSSVTDLIKEVCSLIILSGIKKFFFELDEERSVRFRIYYIAIWFSFIFKTAFYIQ